MTRANVLHQLVVGHKDLSTLTTGILAAIVMLSKLQVLIKFATLQEGHPTLGASAVHSFVRFAITVGILNLRFTDHFFQASHCIFPANQTLPIAFIVCGDT